VPHVQHVLVPTNLLDGKTPIENPQGYKPDISALHAFRWWEPVYARAHDCRFPSESREALCQWVGVAEDTGDVLTYLLLTEDTGKLIKQSIVCLAVTTDNVNLHAEMANSPSLVGEDLDTTSQHLPLRSTADFFVHTKKTPTEFLSRVT
jgi:hypothetical protein